MKPPKITLLLQVVQESGKLWWGLFQGGGGAVYVSSIDGSGSAYPIVECDNASRVIKYVVILGYRYSSYSLVQMRIHDINVVADLTRKNPTVPNPEEPVVYDGTISQTTIESKSMVEDFFVSIQDIIQLYWSGPWPVLHLVVSYSPIPEVTLSLHFGIDILASFTVYPDTIVDLIHPLLVKYAAGTSDTEKYAAGTSDTDTVFQASLTDALEYLLGVGGVPFFAALLWQPQ